MKKEELFLSQFSEEVLKNIDYKSEKNKDDLGLVFQLSKYFDSINDKVNKIKCLNFGLEQNSMCCIDFLADCYFEGDGVEENLEKSVELFEICAKRNFTGSILSLGYLSSQGLGVKKDIDKAKEYYNKAIELGDAGGYTQLAFIYEYNYHSKGVDFKEAARLHKLGAEGGNKISQNQLANFYCNGRGVTKDYKKAIELYLLSAKQGEGVACSSLAELYEKGNGTDIDLEQALYWFKEAHRLGYESKRDITRVEEKLQELNLSADKLYEKGYNYFFGKNGVNESNKEAIKWFRLASVKKHKEAIYYLGYMLLGGLGCDFNYKEATTYIKEAIKLGDKRGNYLLGRLYLFGEYYRKNETKALEYFMLDEDNPNTCYYLGRMYENGLGIKVDLEKAKEYYKKASEENNYAKKSYDVLMGTDSHEIFNDQPYESEVYDAMHGDFNRYPHPIIVDLMIEYKIAHNCTGRFNDGYYAESFYDEMGRMHDWHEYEKEE